MLSTFFDRSTHWSASSALAVVLACTSGAAVAASPYEEANVVAKADSLDPATRDWYLNTMRPAFSKVFQPLVNRCLTQVSREDGQSMGLVFVVDAEGKANRFIWREQNAFSTCLETGLRAATFPAAPKPAFYFGLEARLTTGA